jgi:UDP-glucose 4-epimerase
MKNVLVTGGNGFLGKHVMRLLLQDCSLGVVDSFDNLDPICGGTLESPRIHGDVTEYNFLSEIVVSGGFDTIIHLAAYGRNLSCQDFPKRAWEVNVNGTQNVLEVARQYPDVVKRVVVCSSNITLSDQTTVYKETKLTCERLVSLYANIGVSVMGLRPSNIAGRGQSRTEYQPCSMAGMDMGFARDGYFSITGDGTQARDFVNATDVARAFSLAARIGERGITLDVCTGNLMSLNEIADRLKVPVKYVAARPGDAKVLISDPEPAKNILNFQAQISKDQTLRESFPSVMAKKGME